MTDNVTPIAPTDPPCASCGAVLRIADRFDPTKHDERCRQPEIRLRRAEGHIERLNEILPQVIGQGNDTVTNQVDLNKRLGVLEVLADGNRIAALEGQLLQMQGVIDRYSELVTQLTSSLEHAVDNAGKATLILKEHSARLAKLEAVRPFDPRDVPGAIVR